MAEVLATAAAITQLVHYGAEFIRCVATLPRQLHEAPEKLQNWSTLSKVILGLLRQTKHHNSNLQKDFNFLFVQCEEAVFHIQYIVNKAHSTKYGSLAAWLRKATAIVRYETELKDALLQFQRDFGMLIATLTFLSVSRIEAFTQISVSTRAAQGSASLNLLSRYRAQESIDFHLLAVMAHFGPKVIPRNLLSTLAQSSDLVPALENIARDGLIKLSHSSNDIRLTSSAFLSLNNELRPSIEDPKYLRSAIQALESYLPYSFQRRRDLRRSTSVESAVSALLDRILGHQSELSELDDMTSLISKYCMYLQVMGRYKCVQKVVAKVRVFTPSLAMSNFELATALDSTEASTETCLGHLQVAYQTHRAVYYARVATLGSKDKRALHSLNNLGNVYFATGNYAKALHHHRRVLASKTSLFGSDDPDTALSTHNVGATFQGLHRHDAAEMMMLQALQVWSRIHHPDDLDMLAVRGNLGITYHFQGRFKDSEEIHTLVFRKRRNILGHTHHETMKSQANLAMTLNATGRHEEAEHMYREAKQAFEQSLGDDHPETLKMHHNIATTLHAQGRYAEAESTIRHAVPLIQSKYGKEHFEVLGAMEFRAILLHCLERYAKALEVATRVYRFRQRHLGVGHDDTRRSLAHVLDLKDTCEKERALMIVPVYVTA